MKRSGMRGKRKNNNLVLAGFSTAKPKIMTKPWKTEYKFQQQIVTR